MLDVFGALSGGRLLRLSPVSIDNSVFKLHYRVTVVIMVAFSLLVTSRQYIGDPIDCMATSSVIPGPILDQYCWISTTFSLPFSFNKQVGLDVPYPGVDRSTPNETRVYHQYYQWVCFVLFLQAIMFYLPHYLWKIWEGGRIKALAVGLQIPIMSESDVEAKRDVLVTYFKLHLHNHNFYFFRYYLCEVLNFINVIGQIYFTNRFLGGAFLGYGTEVISYSEMTDQNNRTDPMVRVFPRLTKCVFHTFGSSGDIQKHDALCVLPINIINEKIYIFLWFWFVILAIVSGLVVLYRAFIVVFPSLRLILLRKSSRFSPQEFLKSINEKLHVGDWFVLYQLGDSIDNRLFGKLLDSLAKDLDPKADRNSLV